MIATVERAGERKGAEVGDEAWMRGRPLWSKRARSISDGKGRGKKPNLGSKLWPVGWAGLGSSTKWDEAGSRNEAKARGGSGRKTRLDEGREKRIEEGSWMSGERRKPP